MKATLIISSEYWANQPSVFIFVDGQYFGCQIYPNLRNFPQDVNYWRGATSSDDGRYFSVEDVEYSEEEFNQVKLLQNSIFANTLLLKYFPAWKKSPEYKIKRGKAYQAAIAFRENENKEYQIISDYNRPYDQAITAAKNELRKLLLNK